MVGHLADDRRACRRESKGHYKKTALAVKAVASRAKAVLRIRQKNTQKLADGTLPEETQADHRRAEESQGAGLGGGGFVYRVREGVLVQD